MYHITCIIWYIVSFRQDRTDRPNADLAFAVAWSPDGTRIVSGSAEKETAVQVWDAATGRPILTYRGHTNLVDAVAWSPDGTRIASGSWDTTVQVWQPV